MGNEFFEPVSAQTRHRRRLATFAVVSSTCWETVKVAVSSSASFPGGPRSPALATNTSLWRFTLKSVGADPNSFNAPWLRVLRGKRPGDSTGRRSGYWSGSVSTCSGPPFESTDIHHPLILRRTNDNVAGRHFVNEALQPPCMNRGREADCAVVVLIDMVRRSKRIDHQVFDLGGARAVGRLVVVEGVHGGASRKHGGRPCPPTEKEDQWSGGRAALAGRACSGGGEAKQVTPPPAGRQSAQLRRSARTGHTGLKSVLCRLCGRWFRSRRGGFASSIRPRRGVMRNVGMVRRGGFAGSRKPAGVARPSEGR